jgi:flavin-binding protein dodecin
LTCDGGDRLAVKLVELMGTSSKSWDDAVEEAVAKASESIRGIHGVDILGFKAKIENGKIIQYRADVKIAFVIE